MSESKRRVIENSLGKIGYNTYTFDLQPEHYSDALSILDGMVAQWGLVGNYVRAPISDNPDDSDLDEDSNIPVAFLEAVKCNLALALAPLYGKEPSRQLIQQAKDGKDMLLIHAAKPEEMQYRSNTPRGAGNRARGYFRERRFYEVKDRIRTRGGKNLDL